jgi:hypothetical protein
MYAGVLEQAASCSECESLMKRLKEVGPISRKTESLSKDDKAAINKKTNKKNGILRERRGHLSDIRFDDNHDSLVQPRFWTVWEERVPIIHASYEARVAAADAGKQLLRTSMTPYHRHPARLCSGEDEQAIFPATQRRDAEWLRMYGPPQNGHYVVLRAGDQNDAFWLGKILAIHHDPIAVEKRLQRRRSHQLDKMSRTAAAGIQRIPTPAIHPRLAKLDEHDEQLLNYMQKHRPPNQPTGTAERVVSIHQQQPCFEIRASRHAPSGVQQPSSLGLFATRPIAAGEFIDWYGGTITTQADYWRDAAMPRSHVCSLSGGDGLAIDGFPVAQALTRYVAADADAQTRMLLLPASKFQPQCMYGHMAPYNTEVATLLARFPQLPKGSLINSAAGLPNAEALRNCKRVMHPVRVARGDPPLRVQSIPYMKATRAIAQGEELLTYYKNNEEKSRRWLPHGTVASAAAVSQNAQEEKEEEESKSCSVGIPVPQVSSTLCVNSEVLRSLPS